MGFRLTPRSMTLVDLELRKFEFFREFRGISQISDATTAKPMRIGQYCQRQRCKHFELEQFLTGFRVARVRSSAIAGLSCTYKVNEHIPKCRVKVNGVSYLHS